MSEKGDGEHCKACQLSNHSIGHLKSQVLFLSSDCTNIAPLSN